MRAAGIVITLLMSVNEVSPMPSGVVEWYNTVQNFLGTLHEVLEVGAKSAEKFDADGAQKIRDLEYNWLSLIGYYKGITPLLMDFYFHYLDDKEFENANGEFVRTLDSLIARFSTNSKPETIYKLLHSLTTNSLNKNLFKDGAIKTFLMEMDEIVRNKKVCLELIRQAQAHASNITSFLRFLTNGADSYRHQKSANSEL